MRSGTNFGEVVLEANPLEPLDLMAPSINDLQGARLALAGAGVASLFVRDLPRPVPPEMQARRLTLNEKLAAQLETGQDLALDISDVATLRLAARWAVKAVLPAMGLLEAYAILSHTSVQEVIRLSASLETNPRQTISEIRRFAAVNIIAHSEISANLVSRLPDIDPGIRN